MMSAFLESVRPACGSPSTWLPAVLLAALPGCDERDDVVAVRALVDGGSGTAADASNGSGACGALSICRADLAASAFSRALCSCADVAASGVLGSDLVGASAGEAKASVGVDGVLAGAQLVRVGGDLTLAGTGTLTVAEGVQVTGDLRSAPGGRAGGLLNVSGDAWLESTWTTVGVASVTGNLHLAPGATLGGVLPAMVGGQTSTSSFAVDPPCACGSSSAIDLSGALSEAKATNDDARLGVDPSALGPSRAAEDWSWSCAVVAVEAIGGSAPLHVEIGGRVGLYVQGDVDLPASFVLSLAAGAEIDWFVGGSFTLQPGAVIGDVARPGAVRIYVAGGGPIALPGDSTVALSLYAPSAAVSVGGLGSANGALFAASISAPLGLLVHYDPLAAAEVCPD